jgi:hypothetical protein
MAIWYNLWAFSNIFPVLVCCAKKNLATLVGYCVKNAVQRVRVGGSTKTLNNQKHFCQNTVEARSCLLLLNVFFVVG